MQTIDHKLITDRAIRWNELRYPRKYDATLAMNLLLEETQELYDAKSDIDKLDAVADICFVAIGVFWKLGLNHRQIYDIFYLHDMRTLDMNQAYDWCMNLQMTALDVIDQDLPGAWPGFNLATFSVFVTALGAIRGMGMQHVFYDVCMAICVSNDTKSVAKEKTDPSVKANVNKGDTYVAPTSRLLEIYQHVLKERNKLN